MNRTPMLPRKPAFPSFGPTTLVTIALMFTPFNRTVMSREYIQTPSESVNIPRTPMTDQKRPYRMKRRAELEQATRRAHHRERRRAARLARACAHDDERRGRARRRAPLDALPPLPRRDGAVRGVHIALESGQPGPRPGVLGCDRGSGRPPAPRAGRALRVLPLDAAHAREPPPRPGACQRRSRTTSRGFTATSTARARR